MKNFLQINLDAPGVPTYVREQYKSEGFIKCNKKLLAESNQIRYDILLKKKLYLDYERADMINKMGYYRKLYYHLINYYSLKTHNLHPISPNKIFFLLFCKIINLNAETNILFMY